MSKKPTVNDKRNMEQLALQANQKMQPRKRVEKPAPVDEGLTGLLGDLPDDVGDLISCLRIPP